MRAAQGVQKVAWVRMRLCSSFRSVACRCTGYRLAALQQSQHGRAILADPSAMTPWWPFILQGTHHDCTSCRDWGTSRSSRHGNGARGWLKWYCCSSSRGWLEGSCCSSSRGWFKGCCSCSGRGWLGECSGQCDGGHRVLLQCIQPVNNKTGTSEYQRVEGQLLLHASVPWTQTQQSAFMVNKNHVLRDTHRPCRCACMPSQLRQQVCMHVFAAVAAVLPSERGKYCRCMTGLVGSVCTLSWRLLRGLLPG